MAIATYAVRRSFEIDGQPQTRHAYDFTIRVKTDDRWLAVRHVESPRQSTQGKRRDPCALDHALHRHGKRRA
ncbi:hypothetical protein [Lysobacter brunescens]|uniref:Uncharacterized protein n=1 Tax=Lysobacter brunescens TaxID=262323 RepID=A0ABW2YD88_9GAMM